MTKFSANTYSEAAVASERAAIWDVLTDPELLPELTPLLQKIETDGEIWRWYLTSISALGVSIRPAFTERMTFADEHRIEYTHAPPAGATERSGAEGWYELSDIDGGTLLVISLTLCIDVPLPRAAGPAVRRIMTTTMERTGERFSKNLLAHLGVSGTPFAASH